MQDLYQGIPSTAGGSILRINNMELTRQTVVSEDLAAASFISTFIENYGDNHVPFHINTLAEAICASCYVPIESRKILALYFHNDSEPLSKVFCTTLVSGDVRTLIENRYYLLAWDVSDELYHKALQHSVQENLDLNYAEKLIAEKKSAVFLIFPIGNSITVLSVIHGDIKPKKILLTLQQIVNSVDEEIKIEQELSTYNNGHTFSNDIGSKEFHQLMFDRLGDRDYDCFEFDQHEYLKDKIGFAAFGPPQSENGYDTKQKKQINDTYQTICKYNNMFAEWSDQITISFIYNCVEPLPSEQLKRSKKYSDYNANTDIAPHPIYVIHKCSGSKNNCRIFIDHDRRMYKTWNDYIEDNKLHKCKMVLPKDGRYQGDGDGNVLLETHLSPACGVGALLLRGADITSTAAGLASGGVIIAALIPTVAVAPVALVAAGVVGLSVGVYSLVRSAVHIYDRGSHGESLSFANSEARGAYINIVAASLGFVGAGATAVVSQLASQGVNIGRGARFAVTTVGVMNIGANGVAVANSTYQVVDQWLNEQQSPSILTLVQLSSSILFFGNAVYNFKTATAIIKETQTNTLKEYNDALRSNRHRKIFNKLKKETFHKSDGNALTANAEVIAAVRRIGNKNDVFAVLTRNNKLFNEKGVRFSAENGEIKLNGISVDIIEFGNMAKVQRSDFLVDLSSTGDSVALNTPSSSNITNSFQNVCQPENMEKAIVITESLMYNGFTINNLIRTVFDAFSGDIQNKIYLILKAVVDKFVSDEFDFILVIKKYFPQFSEPMYIILNMIKLYLNNKRDDYENNYQSEKRIAEQLPDYNEQAFNEKFGIHPDTVDVGVKFFEQAVNFCVCGDSIKDSILKALAKFCMNILSKTIDEFCEDRESLMYNNFTISILIQSIFGTICSDTQNKIYVILKAVIDEFVSVEFDFIEVGKKCFPQFSEPMSIILNMIKKFLDNKRKDYEEKYQSEKKVAEQLQDYNEQAFSEKFGIHPDTVNVTVTFFEQAVNFCVRGGSIIYSILKELTEFCMSIFSETMYEFCEERETQKRRESRSTAVRKRVDCSACGGCYFTT